MLFIWKIASVLGENKNTPGWIVNVKRATSPTENEKKIQKNKTQLNICIRTQKERERKMLKTKTQKRT